MGESSPQYAYYWIPISTHAEISALQKLRSEYIRGNHRILKMDLIVVRLSKTGMMNNAEPCYHCLKQLENATYVNIKNVYYSSGPTRIECRKFSDMIAAPTSFISSGYRHRMGKSRTPKPARSQSPTKQQKQHASKRSSSAPVTHQQYIKKQNIDLPIQELVSKISTLEI